MLALACLHTHSPYVYPSISMSVSHQLLHVFVGGWIQVHEPVRVVAAHGQVLVHHLRGLPDVELFDPEEPEEEVVRVDRGFVESEVRVLAAAASKLRLLHQPRAKLLQGRLPKLKSSEVVGSDPAQLTFFIYR